MVKMFKSLEESGLRGFLGASGSVFEDALSEFFANVTVIVGTIVSIMAKRKMVVMKDVFAVMFHLPTEGLVSFTGLPAKAVPETKMFSATGVPFKPSRKKKDMKVEYRMLHDFVAKSLSAKADYFDVVMTEKFEMMVAISAGLKVNWADVLFKTIAAIVSTPGKQSQGYAVLQWQEQPLDIFGQRNTANRFSNNEGKHHRAEIRDMPSKMSPGSFSCINIHVYNLKVTEKVKKLALRLYTHYPKYRGSRKTISTMFLLLKLTAVARFLRSDVDCYGSENLMKNVLCRLHNLGTPKPLNFQARVSGLDSHSDMEIDSAPITRYSKEHQKIYQQWFSFADSDGDGRLTGAEATKFFSMSNLPRQDLKLVEFDFPLVVWAIADSKRQGFLGFKEFVTAMQLVSLAQAGHTLSSDILNTEVDFENLHPPAMDGLDAAIVTTKRPHKIEPEQNGTPAVQSSPSASWFSSSKSAKKVSLSAVTSIIDGLKKLYRQKLKPLEVTYQFNDFVSPLLTNSDFDAKPMVMLLGQYSTGKTTFIKHLLRTSYPGAHIGPEPTTDRFVVVMNGPDERSVPGNTIAVQADMPFSGLTTFGTAFLSKFECSQMPHPLLEHITFVDSPGVLSGEKQRTQRSYDFTGVTSWFAAKCDLILLLFDPHKLDISDEFKRVIGSLRGHDDKIRVVLNKADQVDTQQLMRVYGALMWSLGKVLNTPEVMRVYIGQSFNDKPINEAAAGPIGKVLFEKEQDDLLTDLKDIPKKACDRRINEFVKRARAAKIHAYIISHLRREMPAMMGKAKAQQRLIDNLADEFAKIQREHHLPPGDFPNVDHFRDVLNGYSLDKFEKLKPKMIQSVDEMLGYDIPDLLKNFRNPYD
ncbi:EH domain-containing protein 1 [Dorcoceras hygrometricum]|uniref:EH domain-containing protein 1 n=1 Tax=Dorcoceras hygrometricum TaxID=472368 RepID=A0A2Z7CZ60_9LAMI|nr:EH domain-containing protein 1 [Dorcoceras hygrometricum]